MGDLQGAIHRLHRQIPKKPYAALQSPENTRIYSADAALGCPFIQINGPSLKRYLIVDVDDRCIETACRQAGLDPTWLAISPHRPGKVDGRGHAVFELQEPVTVSAAGRKKPKVILEEVMRRLTTELGGDPGYVGVLTKNPCSPAWIVSGTGKTHNLLDLLNGLEAFANSSILRPTKPLTFGSRNIAIFDSLRHWAYNAWPKWPTLPAGHSECVAHAIRLNRELDRPLPESEVGHIAKSVAKWCWKHRPAGCERGRDRNETAGLSQKQAASIAGRRTSLARRDATDRKIQDAFDRLVAAGHLDPSAQTIADEAGVSRDTVRRWRRRQSAAGDAEIQNVGVQTVHQMIAGCEQQPAPSEHGGRRDGNTAKPCPSPAGEITGDLAPERDQEYRSSARGSAGLRENDRGRSSTGAGEIRQSRRRGPTRPTADQARKAVSAPATA